MRSSVETSIACTGHPQRVPSIVVARATTAAPQQTSPATAACVAASASSRPNAIHAIAGAAMATAAATSSAPKSQRRRACELDASNDIVSDANPYQENTCDRHCLATPDTRQPPMPATTALRLLPTPLVRVSCELKQVPHPNRDPHDQPHQRPVPGSPAAIQVRPTHRWKHHFKCYRGDFGNPLERRGQGMHGRTLIAHPRHPCSSRKCSTQVVSIQ